MLNALDRSILGALAEDCGFTTGNVAEHLGERSRRGSANIRQQILWLEREGYVLKLDNLKPVVWTRTPKGTEALNSSEQ